jgi:hypothetical protein
MALAGLGEFGLAAGSAGEIAVMFFMSSQFDHPSDEDLSPGTPIPAAQRG